MVTVPLSETESASVQEDGHPVDDNLPAISQDDGPIEPPTPSSRPTSVEIMQAFGQRSSQAGSIKSPAMTELESPTISLPEDERPSSPSSTKRSRSDSGGSDRSAHVDWVQLEKMEKTEEQAPREEGQDEV
jgi:hypothetical protein